MRLSACRLLAILVVLVVPAGRRVGAQTQPADTTGVVATVQRLFDGLAQRDTAALRAMLVPGMRIVVVPSDSAPVTPRVQSDSTFLRSLGARSERLLERMWAPVVHVDGPIATLWAPYDFHIDGRFSHCGVDTVTLLRTATGWRVAALVYTVQRRGCAPSPLGAPR